MSTFQRYVILKKYLITQYQNTELEEYIDVLLYILIEKEKEYINLLNGITDITQEGIALDFYGSIIGIHRKEKELDKLYFERIIFKMTALRSSGDIQNSINLIEGLLGFSINRFNELFPATVLWVLSGDGNLNGLKNFLKYGRPAGVRYDVAKASNSQRIISYENRKNNTRQMTILGEDAQSTQQGGEYSVLIS